NRRAAIQHRRGGACHFRAAFGHFPVRADLMGQIAAPPRRPFGRRDGPLAAATGHIRPCDHTIASISRRHYPSSRNISTISSTVRISESAPHRATDIAISRARQPQEYHLKLSFIISLLLLVDKSTMRSSISPL
ncbi:MAG: hypothetical protein ACREE1_13575, partial [Stellaceae bacterium]